MQIPAGGINLSEFDRLRRAEARHSSARQVTLAECRAGEKA
jgi:hypothetical protein